MSLVLLLLVVVPMLGALALLGSGRLAGTGAAAPAARTSIEAAAAPFATAVSGVTAVLAVLALSAKPWATARPAAELDLRWVPALGLRFHLGLDGISAPLVLLTAGLTSLVCLQLQLSQRSLPARHPGLRQLLGCILAVEAGALGTFLALDLLLWFVAFEVVLVPMWAIIRFWGDDHDPAARRDAGLRFVLFTALGSTLLLLGILLVAVTAGTTDIVALTNAHGDGIARGVQVTAAAVMVVGLMVKVPVWPLHTWLPPAHTVAPTAGSVLLAGVLLKLGTYGLVRLVVPVVPQGFSVVSPYLAGLGVVGILWGGLACLVERDLKRLVAYSSVAHMGFVAVGIASGSPQGLQGALFANVAHGLVTGLLFLVAGALKERSGGSSMASIGSALRDRSPRLGWLLAFGCVAGLGLPGLAGFWGEILSAYGAWQPADDRPLGVMRAVAVLTVVGTALAAAYLLRVLYRLWHGDPVERAAGDLEPAGPPDASDASGVELAVTMPLVLATAALGLLPWLLLDLTAPAVDLLLGLGRGVV
ncbi:MAG: NuoM family protein [Actinomycetales bacterium]